MYFDRIKPEEAKAVMSAARREAKLVQSMTMLSTFAVKSDIDLTASWASDMLPAVRQRAISLRDSVPAGDEPARSVECGVYRSCQETPRSLSLLTLRRPSPRLQA